MSNEWRDQDFRDIEELYSLVETGQYVYDGRFELKCTMDRIPPNIEEGLKKPDPGGRFRVEYKQAEYDFLGTSFDFSDAYMVFSDWQSASTKHVDDKTVPHTKLQLSSCKKEIFWPRFMPNG